MTATATEIKTTELDRLARTIKLSQLGVTLLEEGTTERLTQILDDSGYYGCTDFTEITSVRMRDSEMLIVVHQYYDDNCDCEAEGNLFIELNDEGKFRAEF